MYQNQEIQEENIQCKFLTLNAKIKIIEDTVDLVKISHLFTQNYQIEILQKSSLNQSMGFRVPKLRRTRRGRNSPATLSDDI